MRAFRISLPALVIAMGVASPAWASGPAIQEVASGLNSPRHLEFGSHGDLYVAEAGKGGSGPCFVGGEGPACMGDRERTSFQMSSAFVLPRSCPSRRASS